MIVGKGHLTTVTVSGVVTELASGNMVCVSELRGGRGVAWREEAQRMREEEGILTLVPFEWNSTESGGSKFVVNTYSRSERVPGRRESRQQCVITIIIERGCSITM